MSNPLILEEKQEWDEGVNTETTECGWQATRRRREELLAAGAMRRAAVQAAGGCTQAIRGQHGPAAAETRSQVGALVDEETKDMQDSFQRLWVASEAESRATEEMRQELLRTSEPISDTASSGSDWSKRVDYGAVGGWPAWQDEDGAGPSRPSRSRTPSPSFGDDSFWGDDIGSSSSRQPEPSSSWAGSSPRETSIWGEDEGIGRGTKETEKPEGRTRRGRRRKSRHSFPDVNTMETIQEEDEDEGSDTPRGRTPQP